MCVHIDTARSTLPAAGQTRLALRHRHLRSSLLFMRLSSHDRPGGQRDHRAFSSARIDYALTGVLSQDPKKAHQAAIRCVRGLTFTMHVKRTLSGDSWPKIHTLMTLASVLI
jgi:hypothetical protein